MQFLFTQSFSGRTYTTGIPSLLVIRNYHFPMTEKGSHAAPPPPSPQQRPYYDDIVRSKTLTFVVCLSLFYSLLLLKALQRGLALISLGKCGSPLMQVTLTELSISNLRHAFTLNQRITLNYAERSSHTKQIPSRCLCFTKCLSNLNFLVLRSSSGKTKTRLTI